MWKYQFDQSSGEYKPRNRLSLADRVRAIQTYEKTPIYQKVGLLFNCSAKQIRNIVKNKKKIMALYFSGQKTMTKPKKMETLEKALVEWVLRARRNTNVERLSHEMLFATAMQIRDILRIDKFYPDDSWLNQFRDTFQITDEDLEMPLPEHLGPVCLNIQDIIDYVKEREYADALNLDFDNATTWNDPEPEWNDDSLASSSLHVPNSVATTSSRTSSSSLCGDDQQPPSKFPKLEPIDVIEIESDDDEDGPPRGRRSQKNLPITTVEQALRHLKPLEEFALMKEDFRAIGLISQLEAVLSSAKRKQSSH